MADEKNPECRVLGPLISAWLDDELTSRRKAHLEDHLRQCPACRQRLDWLRLSRQAFRDTAPREAPPGFEDRLAERLATGVRRAPARARSIAGGLLAAAAVLLALAYWPRSADPAGVPVAGEEAAVISQQVEPVAAAELSGDREVPEEMAAKPEASPRQVTVTSDLVAPPVTPPAAEASPDPGRRLSASARASGPGDGLGLQRMKDLPSWLACAFGAGGSCRQESACDSPAECGPSPLEPALGFIRESVPRAR